MNKINWNSQEFIDAVSSSISIAEVLRKMGIKQSGGNYKTIHYKIKELKLETTHWLGVRHLAGKKRTIKNTPIKELLIENGRPNSSGYLKIRLLKENLLENKCYICNLQPIWFNKPLVLILDHINGTNSDNRKENLRLLCPNCNSQTDTFCGRNCKREKIIKRCPDCDKQISSCSKRCLGCSKFLMRKVTRPLYEQLINDIKEMPITKVGEKYNVSDNAIRKWIKNYEKHTAIGL